MHIAQSAQWVSFALSLGRFAVCRHCSSSLLSIAFATCDYCCNLLQVSIKLTVALLDFIVRSAAAFGPHLSNLSLHLTLLAGKIYAEEFLD